MTGDGVSIGSRSGSWTYITDSSSGYSGCWVSDVRGSGPPYSCSGSSEMAKEFIKLGFKLGISGPITFLNNRTMKEAVESVSLNDLITETDSPYLTPHPYRGKENGPKYIPLIVEKIAEIKDTNIEEVSKIIRENVKELFNIWEKKFWVLY